MLIRLFQQAPSSGIWGAAASVSESFAWTVISSRLFLLNSSFAIIGASNLWRRSEPCWDSGPGTSPRPITRCDAGGRFQSAKPEPTTTYWGLLKQPDKHESASFALCLLTCTFSSASPRLCYENGWNLLKIIGGHIRPFSFTVASRRLMRICGETVTLSSPAPSGNTRSIS